MRSYGRGWDVGLARSGGEQLLQLQQNQPLFARGVGENSGDAIQMFGLFGESEDDFVKGAPLQLDLG